jgi:hypothetical protein
LDAHPTHETEQRTTWASGLSAVPNKHKLIFLVFEMVWLGGHALIHMAGWLVIKVDNIRGVYWPRLGK